MRIVELIGQIPYLVLQGDPQNTRITGITDYSGRVEPGNLFLCFAGRTTNGTRYLQEAWDRGAVAALTETVPESIPKGLTVLQVSSLSECAGRIAAAFYGWPSEAMAGVGITGTNGKTSTAILLHHILQEAKIRTGLIGTIDNYVGSHPEPAVHTTPQAAELQMLLARMRDVGTEKVVMEVSSHALDQDRDDGMKYAIGVFTNLTQDHLDYHKTMERYAAAKAKLFARCDMGLLNGDDSWWRYYARHCRKRWYTFGFGPDTDFRAVSAAWNADGVAFQWYFRSRYLGYISYPAPGRFQIYNLLAAASAAWLLGIPETAVCQALAVETPLVEGRFERVYASDGLQVIVDYAHTPDGLEQAMKSARDISQGKLITVFGCGGNRDQSKRSIMGELAGRYSDKVIVTSDNPRWEDPEAIMEDIVKGLKNTSTEYITLVDRGEAIMKAVTEADAHDIILVAGKGHEKVQQLGDSRIAFDDAAKVREAINRRQQ